MIEVQVKRWERRKDAPTDSQNPKDFEVVWYTAGVIHIAVVQEDVNNIKGAATSYFTCVFEDSSVETVREERIKVEKLG